MKSFLTVVGLTLAFASGALAMPAGPSTSVPSDVIQVAGGCGAGWHRGPHGGCRRNYARPWLHRCPRGWHPGPYGKCRRNW